MNNIQWKDIYLDGIQSSYAISNNGQVMNKNTKELRSPSITNNGYLRIILYNHGKSYPISIHQLVANYFVYNPDPKTKIQVDHKDGNKLNNWDWNLEWVTPKENTQRAIALGLTDPKYRNQAKGSKSGMSNHTEEQAHAACKLLEQGFTNKEIADKIGVDTEFVRSLKRGGWSHISRNYNIPKPEKRLYYSDEMRDNIKILIGCDRTDLEIAKALGLPDPNSYGRKYVSKIRSRCKLQDKGSTTIPWIIFDFNRNDQQEYGASIWRG